MNDADRLVPLPGNTPGSRRLGYRRDGCLRAEPGSLTSLREKLIKSGANVVSHGGYVTFQVAEVACRGRFSWIS